MATMTMPLYPTDIPFSEVEESVTYVGLGVKRANRYAVILRYLYKALVLSWEFSQTLARQESLIDKLNSPVMQSLSYAELSDFANKIDHLVSLDDNLLDSNSPQFAPWAKLFDQMREQRDTLESIAESYRCAADFETNTLFELALERVIS